MSNLEQKNIPMMIELFYDPTLEVDEIEIGHREFCLELLQETGYICIAGCAGSNNATVGDLDREARYDAIGVPNTTESPHFITGPHPAIEPGVGIWTAAR
jgi:hypothetical protein